MHLFSAHEVDQAGGRLLVALCGEPVEASDLVLVPCPPVCECDPRFCPDCVRAAIRWSAALVPGECPPGDDPIMRRSGDRRGP